MKISRRLYSDYPFLIWVVGWAALLKGVVWLSTDPVLPDRQLTILGYKYIIMMVPFIVCGLGIWKMKKWAAGGLMGLCLAELLFFFFFPFALDSLAINKISLIAMILSQGIFLINGPVSAIAVLICLPFVLPQLTVGKNKSSEVTMK